jgi:lipopolysaccharide transport system ATP-binding protein
MPSNLAICTENLGKLYRLGLAPERYRTLRESIMEAGAASWGLLRRAFRSGSALQTPADSHTFWALKDVSLEVARGEVFGIVGRNGAGKTTLLKILSRITEPTSGRVQLNGRVGSLLEVGTGFHPELTGRENIFLNGAILGMTRQEIQRKFDEIVDFAEIARFIDNPLKRYSSGMGARLAFAVAAHLEPEILLVDEVLAVGDQGFRKKCLGKMKDVGQEGRTVLFISHDLNAISRLCQKALWLEEGKVQVVGEVQDVVSSYAASFKGLEVQSYCRVERHKPPQARKYFSWVSLANLQGKPRNVFRCGEGCRLTVGMVGDNLPKNHFVEWFLLDQTQGSRVAWGASYFHLDKDVPREATEISFVIGPLPLAEGHYSFSFSMGVRDMMQLDMWSDAIDIEIIGSNPDGSCHHYSNRYAPVIIPYNIDKITVDKM